MNPRRGPGPVLQKRVLRFIEEHALVEAGAPLVVGVSGGADSVCLAHILAHLRDSLGIELHLAHLNHLLRGSEADADAEYVAQLSRLLGVPATIERRDVAVYRKRQHCSLEEAAREVRYTFLAEVAALIGARRVAVGHTADDQVETILLHLIRGTGLTGLGGIRPLLVWPKGGAGLMVVRPLLEITREKTESYCATYGLSPRRDSSNRSPAHLRNRVRLELIPQLESYNRNISAALLRAASSAAADLAFIKEAASGLWGSLAREFPDRVELNLEAMSRLPPALQRHLLRSALERLLGSLKDIGSAHIEAMLKLLAEPVGKRLSLPGGLVFSGDYHRCTLAIGIADNCPFPGLGGEHRLTIPGETALPGWLAKASILKRPPGDDERQDFRVYLDFDVAGEELVVRPRRDGDKFQPLGMDKPKKLQDFMVDAKIPRAWRARVPVVCSPQHIIWIVGWRIDHRARVSAATKRILCLEFARA